MSIAYKISGYNRNRKWKRFKEVVKFNEHTRVLDVGFSDKEYSATDNYIDKNYPYPDKLTALGVEEPIEFEKKYPAIKAVKYDGSIFPFDDKTYDVCWSNAVIEHVGSRKNQLLFIKEISRTSKVAFITTPNKYFPFEVHTRVPLLHYLPKGTFDKFLKLIGKEWAAGDYMNLLSLRDIRKLLKEAGIKEYRIIKNRFLIFTMDYILVWESCA